MNGCNESAVREMCSKDVLPCTHKHAWPLFATHADRCCCRRLPQQAQQPAQDTAASSNGSPRTHSAAAKVDPVVVIGAGPAGLFAALAAAEAGLPVVLLERGMGHSGAKHALATAVHATA